MPSLGFLLGGIDFTKYSYVAHSLSGGEVTIKYGQFLQNTFDFLVIALTVFVAVTLINRAAKKVAPKPVETPAEPEAPAPKPDDVMLLEEIRDLLAGKEKAEASPKKPEKKS